jgi:hypothetical protein
MRLSGFWLLENYAFPWGVSKLMQKRDWSCGPEKGEKCRKVTDRALVLLLFFSLKDFDLSLGPHLLTA